MASKYFLGIIFLVFINFISSQTCEIAGSLSNGKYCDVDGQFKTLKTGGAQCINDYECVGESCVEGICSQRFESAEKLIKGGDKLGEIWEFFTGEECDPEIDIGYFCQGNTAYLCGSGKAWEEKGEIPGICGVPLGSEDGENGGGGSGSIKIIFFSPQDGMVYSSTNIPLRVIDTKRNARFWKYSLNSGSLVDFTPNTSINSAVGLNTLNVYASKYSSFSNSYGEEVSFRVDLSSQERVCGDGFCDENEDCSSCVNDCGYCPVVMSSYCGDNTCDLDESSFLCPADCKEKVNKSYMWLFYIIVFVLFSGIGVVSFFIVKRLRGSFSKPKKTSQKPASLLNMKSPISSPFIRTPFPRGPMAMRGPNIRRLFPRRT